MCLFYLTKLIVDSIPHTPFNRRKGTKGPVILCLIPLLLLLLLLLFLLLFLLLLFFLLLLLQSGLLEHFYCRPCTWIYDIVIVRSPTPQHNGSHLMKMMMKMMMIEGTIARQKKSISFI